MSLINNNFLKMNSALNNVKTQKDTEKETIKKEFEQEKPAPKNDIPTPSQSTAAKVNNDFLMIYRGIEINHIETALKKEVVKETNNKVLTYVVDNSVIKNSTISSGYYANSVKTGVLGLKSNSKLNSIADMASSDLNSVADEIKKQLKASLGASYVEKDVQQAIDAAIAKTIKTFEDGQKSVRKSSNDEQAFIFVRKNLIGSVGKYQYSMKSLTDTFIANYNEIAKTKQPKKIEVPAAPSSPNNASDKPVNEVKNNWGNSSEIITSEKFGEYKTKLNDKLTSVFDTYSEQFGEYFDNKNHFKTLFENAKQKTTESLMDKNECSVEDLRALFEKNLNSSINNYFWGLYEQEQLANQNTQSKTRAASTVSSNKTSNSTAVGANTTFKTNDGTSIKVNYEGAFVNGLLVTNPATNSTNCTITITTSDGKTKTVPFSVGMNLLPKPNQRALDAYKKELNSGMCANLDEFLFQNSNYKESDFKTQKEWFDQLMTNVSTMMKNVPSNVLNDLAAENTLLSIDSEYNRPMDASDASGTYNNATNTVSLYTTVNKNNGTIEKGGLTAYTITHEVGHAKDYSNRQNQSTKLTGTLEDFVNFKSMIPEDLKNAYALSNVMEFFAEYYAYKNTPDLKNQKSSRLFDYLDKQLAQNPNSNISKAYGQIKNNAEGIISNKNIGNDAAKENTYKDNFNDLFMDGTYFKNPYRAGAIDSFDQLVPRFGKTSVNNLISEYYAHKFLKLDVPKFKALDALKPGDKDYDAWQNLKKMWLDPNVDKFDKDYPDVKNKNSFVDDKNNTTQTQKPTPTPDIPHVNPPTPPSPKPDEDEMDIIQPKPLPNPTPTPPKEEPQKPNPTPQLPPKPPTPPTPDMPDFKPDDSGLKPLPPNPSVPDINEVVDSGSIHNSKNDYHLEDGKKNGQFKCTPDEQGEISDKITKDLQNKYGDGYQINVDVDVYGNASYKVTFIGNGSTNGNGNGNGNADGEGGADGKGQGVNKGDGTNKGEGTDKGDGTNKGDGTADGTNGNNPGTGTGEGTGDGTGAGTVTESGNKGAGNENHGGGGKVSGNYVPGTDINLSDPKYQGADGKFNMALLVKDLAAAGQAFTTTDTRQIQEMLNLIKNRYGNTVSAPWDKYWSELGFGYTDSINMGTNEETWGSSSGVQDNDYFNSITAGYAAAQQAAQEAANKPKDVGTAGYTNGYEQGSTDGYSSGYNPNGYNGSYNYTHTGTGGYSNGY